MIISAYRVPLPIIDWEICQACEPCQARKVCKTRAIVQLDPGEIPYIDPARCTRCVLCVNACPSSAIIMGEPGDTHQK